MLWVQRGAGTGSSSNASASQTPATGPVKANDILLWAIGQDVAGATVTSIACDSGSGSFTQLAAIDAAARGLFIWIGYGFSGDPTAFTITCSQAGWAYARHHITTDRDWTGWTPTYTASAGNTGTSTSADSNTVTPTAGDMLVAACVQPSTTSDSTGRTHTGNSYLYNTGGEFSTNATRVEIGYAAEALNVSSKEVWTLGSSVAWAAIQAKFTPPATLMSASAAKILKGRATYALDDAAVA